MFSSNEEPSYTEDMIKRAFKQGYMLGLNDTKEGIYISFVETENYFLEKLKTSINQDVIAKTSQAWDVFIRLINRFDYYFLILLSWK